MAFIPLETSLKDVAELSIASSFFVAEKDPWVSQEAVRSVFEESSADLKSLYIIPGIIQELFQIPVAAVDTCCGIVRAAEQCVDGIRSAGSPIPIPTGRALIARTHLRGGGVQRISRQRKRDSFRRSISKICAHRQSSRLLEFARLLKCQSGQLEKQER